MRNHNDHLVASILGHVAAAVIIDALDEDLRYMRIERSAWARLANNERAVKTRSYARNVLKTIRETPSSLSNQKSQCEKLVRLVRLAHSLDRGVVGYNAVNEVESLHRDLRWERGYLPVAVRPIDIS